MASVLPLSRRLTLLSALLSGECFFPLPVCREAPARTGACARPQPGPRRRSRRIYGVKKVLTDQMFSSLSSSAPSNVFEVDRRSQGRDGSWTDRELDQHKGCDKEHQVGKPTA